MTLWIAAFEREASWHEVGIALCMLWGVALWVAAFEGEASWREAVIEGESTVSGCAACIMAHAALLQ